MATFWRTFHHDGKISPAWCGWGCTHSPLSLYLTSRAKLWGTLRRRGQIHSLHTPCSARDWDRIRITWGNPQSGCTDICSYSKRATVGGFQKHLRQKYWRTQHALIDTEIYTNISSKKSGKTYCKIELAELTAKIIKC
jgi:hypothetical protein